MIKCQRVDVRINEHGDFYCPYCGRHWSIKGRGGAAGFIISAAKSHVQKEMLNRDPLLEQAEAYFHNYHNPKRGH